MSFPTNERLRELYAAVADTMTTEDVERILRRAGEDPTGQELKDVRHRLRELLRERGRMAS